MKTMTPVNFVNNPAPSNTQSVQNMEGVKTPDPTTKAAASLAGHETIPSQIQHASTLPLHCENYLVRCLSLNRRYLDAAFLCLNMAKSVDHYLQKVSNNCPPLPENLQGQASREWITQQLAEKAKQSWAVNIIRLGVTKDVSTGMKQYKFGGSAVGPQYQHQTAVEKNNRKAELIAETQGVWLTGKKNPFSPFLKRTLKITPFNDERSLKQIALGNMLAALLHKNPEKSKYISVDFYVGRKKMLDTFLSRRVNGFSLDNDARLADAIRSGELSKEKIEEKMAELSDAVKWINDQGYFHNDISHLGNIMYDTKAKIFVLIDSEMLSAHSKYKFRTESELVHILKKLLYSFCDSLQTPVLNAQM